MGYSGKGVGGDGSFGRYDEVFDRGHGFWEGKVELGCRRGERSTGGKERHSRVGGLPGGEEGGAVEVQG